MLKLANISKSFFQAQTGRVPVLRDINFNLGSGETLAITGHSGSGKTTLLSLIAGLDSPDEGSVFLDGRDVCAMDEASLTRYRAEKIGMVFQSFHLMPYLSALENIRLPLEILKQDRIRERAGEMLESVGLTDRAGHLPAQLSGGECQRVAIARALIVRPALMLADEPTGNLDADTGDRVADLLFKLVQDRQTALVVVTHNRDLAGRCGDVRRLVHGRLS